MAKICFFFLNLNFSPKKIAAEFANALIINQYKINVHFRKKHQLQLLNKTAGQRSIRCPAKMKNLNINNWCLWVIGST